MHVDQSLQQKFECMNLKFGQGTLAVDLMGATPT